MPFEVYPIDLGRSYEVSLALHIRPTSQKFESLRGYIDEFSVATKVPTLLDGCIYEFKSLDARFLYAASTGKVLPMHPDGGPIPGQDWAEPRYYNDTPEIEEQTDAPQE